MRHSHESAARRSSTYVSVRACVCVRGACGEYGLQVLMWT